MLYDILQSPGKIAKLGWRPSLFHFFSIVISPFSTREHPKGISRSYCRSLRYANHSLTRWRQSSVLKLEGLRCPIWKRHIIVVAEVLPKCTLDNFKRAFTLATSWENSGNEFTLTFSAEKTSTLAVDLISSEGRVFTSYAMSMSIIRTAGMA